MLHGSSLRSAWRVWLLDAPHWLVISEHATQFISSPRGVRSTWILVWMQMITVAFGTSSPSAQEPGPILQQWGHWNKVLEQGPAPGAQPLCWWTDSNFDQDSLERCSMMSTVGCQWQTGTLQGQHHCRPPTVLKGVLSIAETNRKFRNVEGQPLLSFQSWVQCHSVGNGVLEMTCTSMRASMNCPLGWKACKWLKQIKFLTAGRWSHSPITSHDGIFNRIEELRSSIPQWL